MAADKSSFAQGVVVYLGHRLVRQAAARHSGHGARSCDGSTVLPWRRSEVRKYCLPSDNTGGPESKLYKTCSSIALEVPVPLTRPNGPAISLKRRPGVCMLGDIFCQMGVPRASLTRLGDMLVLYAVLHSWGGCSAQDATTILAPDGQQLPANWTQERMAGPDRLKQRLWVCSCC